MARMTPAWCTAVDWGNYRYLIDSYNFGFLQIWRRLNNNWECPFEECWNYRVVAEKSPPTGYEGSEPRETSTPSQTVPPSLSGLHHASWCSQGLSQGSKVTTASLTVFWFWAGWHQGGCNHGASSALRPRIHNTHVMIRGLWRCPHL